MTDDELTGEDTIEMARACGRAAPSGLEDSTSAPARTRLSEQPPRVEAIAAVAAAAGKSFRRCWE